MAQKIRKTIVMRSEPAKGMKIFTMVTGVAAFAALWFLLVSALPFQAGRYAAAVAGVAAAAVYLAFGRKRIVALSLSGAVALYTALAVGAGFFVFRNGALLFWNGVAESVNANVHGGLSYAQAEPSAGAEFLFSSVVSAWLGLACAAASARSRYAWIYLQFTVTFVLLCTGLYPSVYAIGVFAVAFTGLLVAENGMTLKSALHWVTCALIVAAAAIPCMFYAGSEGVRELQRSAVYAFERAVYGANDLPDGNLSQAGKMHASSGERLTVTMTPHTPVLYLKGFAGSSLTGSRWEPTDKNAYVQNGYQGLLEYLAEGGLSLTQYARYSSLSGSNDKFGVQITNTGAYRKYAYAPYTVSEYTEGSPYYDLNLRGGGRSYSYTVFAGDISGERVTQADWVTESANRTQEMTDYLEREKEYRAFVYDTYAQIDGASAELIRAALGGIGADSVNTVAQLTRAYFLNSFSYGSEPDPLGEGGFVASFFGGEVNRANAAYFASAATQIFRSYGFAARYAEGYLARGDFSGEGSTARVVLTGRDAHAWTEVYFDGIGWLPVEVTPSYFSDGDSDSVVDPDAPDAPEEEAPPAQPELPPEDQPEPELPPVTPVLPDGGQEKKNPLLTALQVLVPVLGIVSIAAAAALGFVARREVVLRRKRRLLEGGGEQFGRAAYTLLERDLKGAGGFTEQTLEGLGINRRETERFRRITERCVFGGFDPTENERGFVIGFMEKAGDALLRRGELLKRVRNRYVLCIGIR